MLIDDPRPTESPIPERNTYLTVFANTIHANNVAKGFWPEIEGNRNFGELIALIHAEITEAIDGAIENVPDDKLPRYTSFQVELADVLIRLLDAWVVFGKGDVGSLTGSYRAAEIDYAYYDSLDGKLGRVHRLLSYALESHRKNTRTTYTGVPFYSVNLDQAIQQVLLIADDLFPAGVTIEEVARAKVEFNTTRPHKHGIAY